MNIVKASTSQVDSSDGMIDKPIHHMNDIRIITSIDHFRLVQRSHRRNSPSSSSSSSGSPPPIPHHRNQFQVLSELEDDQDEDEDEVKFQVIIPSVPREVLRLYDSHRTNSPELSPEPSKPESSKRQLSIRQVSKPQPSKPEASNRQSSKPQSSKPQPSKPQLSKPQPSKPEAIMSRLGRPISLDTQDPNILERRKRDAERARLSYHRRKAANQSRTLVTPRRVIRRVIRRVG